MEISLFMVGFILLGLYVHWVKMRWKHNPRGEWDKLVALIKHFRW